MRENIVHAHFSGDGELVTPTQRAVNRALECGNLFFWEGKYFELGGLSRFLNAPEHEVVSSTPGNQAEEYPTSMEYSEDDAVIFAANFLFTQQHGIPFRRAADDLHISPELRQKVLAYLRCESDQIPQIEFL